MKNLPTDPNTRNSKDDPMKLNLGLGRLVKLAECFVLGLLMAKAQGMGMKLSPLSNSRTIL